MEYAICTPILCMCESSEDSGETACMLMLQKDTMTVYSEPNGEIMPRQCCMQSSDLEKVRTHLMSDVYTLVIDLILVRK